MEKAWKGRGSLGAAEWEKLKEQGSSSNENPRQESCKETAWRCDWPWRQGHWERREQPEVARCGRTGGARWSKRGSQHQISRTRVVPVLALLLRLRTSTGAVVSKGSNAARIRSVPVALRR